MISLTRLVWFLSWDAWQEEGWAETPKTWFKQNWLIDCIVFAPALAISICDRQFCIQFLMECFILLYCHNLKHMTAVKFILRRRPLPIITACLGSQQVLFSCWMLTDDSLFHFLTSIASFCVASCRIALNRGFYFVEENVFILKFSQHCTDFPPFSCLLYTRSHKLYGSICAFVKMRYIKGIFVELNMSRRVKGDVSWINNCDNKLLGSFCI